MAHVNEIEDLQDEAEVEKIVLTRLMRLNATIVGLITGLVAGLGLFAATIFLVLKGGDVVGPHLGLLGQYFPGYTVTFGGSLLGFVYFFIVGFVSGFAVAFLYNWLAGIREDSRSKP